MNSKLREIWQKRHHPQTTGKTKIYDMSKDRNYQRLLNAKRWAETKLIVRERTNGLCEECLRNNIKTPGTDCHHVIPVETANSLQEMEELCYNPNNVRLLCVKHHSEIHKAMGKGTKKLAKERAEQRAKRWLDSIANNFITPTDTIKDSRK